MTLRDDEWRQWTAAWRGGDEAPAPALRAAILRRVKRRTLGLRLLVAGEVALVAGALALLAWLSRTSPHRVDAAVAAGLALLAVAAFGFSLWNRRGVWRTAALTTADLLAFSLARARRRRRGLAAGWALLAAEVALLAPWVWLHAAAAAGGPPATATLARAYLFLVAWSAGAAMVLALLGRWTGREIARLEELRREIGAVDEAARSRPGSG